jgi:hypothetical protein
MISRTCLVTLDEETRLFLPPDLAVAVNDGLGFTTVKEAKLVVGGDSKRPPSRSELGIGALLQSRAFW